MSGSRLSCSGEGEVNKVLLDGDRDVITTAMSGQEVQQGGGGLVIRRLNVGVSSWRSDNVSYDQRVSTYFKLY